jgi:NADH-quinone oxidoreductase subunit N
MLAGVVVTTRLGIQATVFYLGAYLLMNLAAFAVIAVRERETDHGDDFASLNGLGADRPVLGWCITIAMLALAGFPATVGFFGKIYLIQAAVDNDYAWLGVAIVLGSAMSLAYYLRVVAAVWMRPDEVTTPRLTAGGRPVLAGGAPVVDPDVRRGTHTWAVGVAVACAAATIVFGVYPEPLFDAARDAGQAISSLL